MSPNDTTIPGDLTRDEILDELEKPIPEADTDDTVKLPEEKEDKDQPVEDVDGEEIKEDLREIEEEVEAEEKIDDIEYMAPIKRRDILDKYPKFFKDFPLVEKAIFRDRAFSEIFPSPQDATEAYEKSTALDNFEKDLSQGNIDAVLDAIKQEDKKAFYKIVDNYLPQLHKVDPQAYFHVVGNVTKMTISNMVQEAKRTGNEALESAATLLHQFVFATTEWKPPRKLVGDEPKEVNELKQREQQFNEHRLDTITGELSTKIRNSLRASIDTNIDPKGSMSDYVKKNVSKDVLEAAERAIETDKAFRGVLNKLWDRAAQSDYSDESVRKIRSAIISKANTVLPSLIKKARAEAFGSAPKKEISDKSPVRPGRSASSSNTSGKKLEVPKGMKAIDFLMQD